MEKREYVKKLKAYTQANGLSIYDYYYLCAKIARSDEKYVLPEFEANNPFLTEHDIQLLLNSTDPYIEEYFANAMTKVISLQTELLSREEIREVIDDKMAELTDQDSLDEVPVVRREGLSRDDIREVIDDKTDELTDQDSLDDVPVVKKEGLSREEIETVINDQVDSLGTGEDVEDEPSHITRDEIKEVIQEKLGLLSSLKVKITSIGKKIADLLNGFAVIKEEKTGRTHLYHHDAKKDTLKGEQVYYNNQLNVGSGYYVNYQEYLDRMLDEFVEKYPTATDMHFVRDDGMIKTFDEVVEEAYDILVQNGVLKFGSALKGKTFKTYREFQNLGIDEVEEYAGEPLKVGIYVRRDILTRIFAKYKIKANVLEEEELKQSIK